MSEYALQMHNITKKFGTTYANKDVTLNVKKGTIHGLLGENGAGKTTLMNILYGLYAQDTGEIFIKSKKVNITTPAKAIELGIGMVHQHFMLVRPLSVVENIVLGLESDKKPFLNLNAAKKKIKELSEMYKLKVDPDAKIWQLSVGEQQRVEILSALYRGAEILILDEPTAVLTPKEVKELFEILNIMRKSGKAIIFITHKLEEIMDFCDEITVLRDGEKVSTVEKKAITPSELTKMMVGREVLFDFKRSKTKPGKTILKVENISAKNNKGLQALKEISFELKEGEVLGIAGVDGNGQSELCEVLTGLRPATGGSIKVSGSELIKKAPKEFIKKGIAHIPEDRQKTGLAMNFSVMKNFIIKEFDTKKFSKKGFLNFKAIKEYAEKQIKEFMIKTSSKEARVRELSGGNQQKIILSREIHCNPKVLIANQPTRGLDLGATEYVRQRLLDEKEKGVGVLLISADLDEILQLSDRILVLYEGQIMGIVNRENVNLDEIGMLMAGMRGEVGA